ncbi:homeobox protein ATH1 [Cajanus cajan]|uniref:homeobox protein ATH1 n=1 Tax=Cajanus cajan TaxID=3821 RepID=UPI00098DA119|nr:homeobox protein ATH1 [Cajanus cajan]XP_020208846.1 homeobox protein ATH1 [Cajanus cajan]XP_020208857.1 homeobox protein ATH1 [Cajanus cajan]XP_029129924.1 homeobox protein ATH1 [Cajanus cajan]
MENNMYSAPLDMAGRISTAIEEITQHLAPKPLVHCYSFDLNNQSHIIDGIPVLAGGEQGEPTSDVHVDGCFINPATIADSNSFIASQGKTVVGDASNPINNNDFHEHLAGGRPITSASLAARISLQENLENSSAALPPSFCSLEAIGPYIFNNWQDTSNPLHATFGDHAYDELPGIHKWNVNKFLKAPEVDGTGILAYSTIGNPNLDQNGWTSSNVANLANLAYNSSNCSNELSLSLARSPTTGQCSEMSCSDVSNRMNVTTMSGLEQPSCSSKDLSMRLDSNKHVQFSPAILGSRYLAGIQEILTQIATYSFENVELMNYSVAGVRAGGNNNSASAFTPKRRVAINQNANSMFEAHVEESPLERHATESNKSQLLVLLQLVDNRYSECLDEIHTVVSAFHAATELDPHIMHAHFALQTITLLYKDLRERISNHILAMGPDFNSLCSEEEKEWCVETSFIQKQWALQQLKRKDHLWRPQRGLPERSVSVLRAWMFQNFLHPYPKDAEKHLLAVKSGLTRSQVSNWFINARVRLWKPMIEEMYAEMNRRKACRNEEGMESTHRSRLSMNNQMLNIN